MAHDEWSGLRSPAEILAAFVLPTQPEIEGILAEASRILKEWTGDGSLSGYQTKSAERAFRTTEAIYAALRGPALQYINPPASFEQSGQKIRLPHRILENKLGTCLDLALLCAACLEQAGLSPLVIFTQGHAFPGVWLEEECFEDCAGDDGLRLKKRVDLKEICVFESTMLTHGPAGGFENAVATGRRQFDNLDAFLCVVDIHRCRKSRIRPLPVRTEGGKTVFARSAETPQSTDAAGIGPSAGFTPAAVVDVPSETPETRLDKWKRSLLDLTLNNRLLNFRETQKTLPLFCFDPAMLEDALAEGDKFRIHERPAEMNDAGSRDAELHRLRTGGDVLDELIREEFKARRLRADLSKEDLDRRLLEIYREWRSGLEESGAGTLYLALGFLSWFEAANSSKARLAPLVLIPLELERRSVREGFSISLGGEEPRINTTLLQMLSRDHGLNIPLSGDSPPMDEHGIDVRGILDTFRKAVKEIPRWEIVETVRIGLFSFAKHLMWRDLEMRAGDLMRNKVVAHLIERPGETFPSGGDFPDPDRLDQSHPPEKTFCPLIADSSQLAAVYAAAEGKSFVLEGPPGTGKSQTIANLIAHCLATEKTVLFVSEKMAALNVVHSRLRRIGLEPFCLELHSNKSHKLQVVQQLESALQRIEGRSSEEWTRETERLAGLRGELNGYVHALHLKRETGESLFQGSSRRIGLRAAKPVRLDWPADRAMDRRSLDGLREIVGRLRVAAESMEHPSRNVWNTVEHAEWSPVLERKIQEALSDAAEAADCLQRAGRETGPLLGVAQGDWAMPVYAYAERLAGCFLDIPDGFPMEMLIHPEWKTTHGIVRERVTHGRRRDELRRDLFGRYDRGVLDLDLEGLREKLEQAENTWFFPRFWKRMSVKRAVKAVLRDGNMSPPDEILSDLNRALALCAEESRVREGEGTFDTLLGVHWNAGEADWNTVEGMLEWCDRMHGMAVLGTRNDPRKAAALRERWAIRTAAEGREEFVAKLLEMRRAHGVFANAARAMENERILGHEALGGNTRLTEVMGGIRERLERISEFRAWCHWRKVRKEAVDAGLGAVVAAYESGMVMPDGFSPAFESGYYHWWVERTVQADPELRSFFSPEFERKITQFREADERYTELTRDEIRARLAARLPAVADATNPNSEMGILNRQIRLRRGHMPIRRLFQEISNLLPLLKPCLLMSPISVAQYLDPAHPPFDLVVFDEASQIPVWDAVGALARGREAVVVGDPKQLPPTSFFSRSDDDGADGDDGIVQDLESILDECSGAGLPRRHLNWHYRSRHESLIAFSNHHYYGNRLLTFPSPHRDKGVSLRRIDGRYDRSKSRTNRAEAEAVTAEVVRRLAHPELSKRSIGVVTFSAAQQGLIEDLLEAARRDHPEIESFFSHDGTNPEPVFIKNLENVQGDERDVILFSVCYGPDDQGRVSVNFGPLNREGGERRLNVAVTRARWEMIVFSTLRADQIDLSRTRARGVSDLKCFLDYAERGPVAIAEALSTGAGDDFDSPFEEQVCDELRNKGYTVHSQVGCSGYRIDLAVVDPQAPGRYLLGVECDGANYHSARTARDRDRLRESVLRGLGWQIHRVWSTDWWSDPGKELDRIESAVEKARLNRNAAQEEVGEEENPPDAFVLVPESVKPFAGNVTELVPSAVPDVSLLNTYAPWVPDREPGTPETFYLPAADAEIRRIVEAVTAAEGPIAFDLLVRRVIALWNMFKVTDKARSRINTALRKVAVKRVEHGSDLFLWPEGFDPETWSEFRTPGENDASKRTAGEIPPEEAANAARVVLERNIGLPLEDLVRETARLFGFQRVGPVVKLRMEEGVRLLVRRGNAVERDGKVVCNH